VAHAAWTCGDEPLAQPLRGAGAGQMTSGAQHVVRGVGMVHLHAWRSAPSQVLLASLLQPQRDIGADELGLVVGFV